MAHKNKSNYSPIKNKFANHQGRTHKKPQQIYSLEEANDRLYDTFKNHDFNHITHAQRKQLAHFYTLLVGTQQSQNFTRITEIKEIAIKHFIDCLIVNKLHEIQFPLLDVGTGPGFPGIPLKILNPDKKIILAEGVQKRVEFLKTCRDEMALSNLVIIGRNVNSFFAYPCQSVITRAVEDIGNTLKNVLTCLHLGGEVLFMKGPQVDQELKLVPKDILHYYKLEKDIAYDLPKTQHKRRLVVFKKINSAPVLDFEQEPWPGEN